LPPSGQVFARIVAALVAMGATASVSHAQAGARPRAASVSGVVRDSTSRAIVEKAAVCALMPTRASPYVSRCARVDTAGVYRIDSLPPGALQLSVSCETLRGLGKSLAVDTMVVGDSGLFRHDWLVSTVGCDPRPLRRVTGIFSGHYTTGFEASDFIPCAEDGWFIPGDSLDSYSINLRRAWATWSAGVDAGLAWPDVPRDSYGYSRYYVTWRGTVVGPGRYGHLGAALFEIRVDSILTVRAPRNRDCR
jgi:hypothetical protein